MATRTTSPAHTLAPLQQLEGIRSAIAALSGWRRLAAAFLAGALSVLAMAPFFAWPVLFLTLPVLVWLIDGAVAGATTAARLRWLAHLDPRILSAATIGWWFGFGYFLFGLYWIGAAFLVEAETFAWLLPFAVTSMPAGLAIFYAVATAAAALLWKPGLSRLIVLAVALAVAEWLRGHIFTGLPWNALGYALTFPLPLMQSAAIFGIYGLTLFAILIFAAPLVLAAEANGSRSNLLLGAALAGVPLALLYAYGAAVLARGPAPMVEGVRLRIVQPSIAQREKWQPENQRQNFDAHLDLSRRNPEGRVDDLAGITHVIWPEAAMPFRPLEYPVAIEDIAKLLPPGTQLLAGALRRDEPAANATPGSPLPRRRYYNSLMVFDAGGNLEGLYDKIHLVPFGEYLPFQETLEWMGLEQLTRQRGGFSIGVEPRPLLDVKGLPPVGALICYEAVFPAAVVQGSARPGLLINITNDGWFGNTTGPQQHFHQARVRAVEEGLPLVRAANNGISAMIDANGRVLSRLALDVKGTIDTGLPAARPTTPYARYGDMTFLFLTGCFLTAGVVLGHRRA